MLSSTFVLDASTVNVFPISTIHVQAQFQALFLYHMQFLFLYFLIKRKVDVTTIIMARKPMKLQKENPAGCAGEGKQSKGN